MRRRTLFSDGGADLGLPGMTKATFAFAFYSKQQNGLLGNDKP
jgi:hypothetical protein